MKRLTLLLSAVALAGCTADGRPLFGGGSTSNTRTTTQPPPAVVPPRTVDPNQRVDTNRNPELANVPPPVVAPPPPQNAVTPEQFDTTTPEQRDEAVVEAPPPSNDTAGDGRLGTTVASIGAADEPGFWIKTPLVASQSSGRLFYPATGRTVQVQLIPSGAGSGSGSEVSLAALRLLDAPLDGLPELVVYEN